MDSQQMNIQWYPGHMTRTRRRMEEDLKFVDIVVEIIDARIPISSRNPDIDTLCAGKPRLIVLNRADQADPAGNKQWGAHFRAQGHTVLETDAKTGRGINQFSPVIQSALKDQIAKWREKGQVGRPVRAMVVGVPNVGKSTLINRMSGGTKAKAENRPGVTRDKQWVTTRIGLDLLDMPGVLWPKFEDQIIGENLALTGAIKDDILDVERMGCILVHRLREMYPAELAARYKLTDKDDWTSLSDFDLVTLIGRTRGCLISGGEVDTERASNLLLDEFRAARIGKLTIDQLPD